MGMMKHIGMSILEELNLSGPGTRKELHNRTQVTDWSSFKRFICHLLDSNMIFKDEDNRFHLTTEARELFALEQN